MKGIDLRCIVLKLKPRQERGGDDCYSWEDIWRREGEMKGRQREQEIRGDWHSSKIKSASAIWVGDSP